MYRKIVSISHGKNDNGKAASPSVFPSAVNGIAVKTAMPVKEMMVSGKDARLCINGIFGVRSICITKVCVHIDSTNQPAWKTAINIACVVGSVSSWYIFPPVTAGQIIKYNSAYVDISNTELVGPIHNINLPIDEDSHFLGLARNSLSTLSQGIAEQLKS